MEDSGQLGAGIHQALTLSAQEERVVWPRAVPTMEVREVTRKKVLSQNFFCLPSGFGLHLFTL